MQTCHLIAANLVHDYNWISLKLLRKMKNLNLIKQAHLQLQNTSPKSYFEGNPLDKTKQGPKPTWHFEPKKAL